MKIKTIEDVEIKYKAVAVNESEDGSPCLSCDAFDECEEMANEPVNPFFRVCHDEYNLKER